MISVIITTYQRPKNLIRAIKSILNQTYNDWELIIVDDNDERTEYRKETEHLMSQYSNNNKIRYLRHKKNQNGAAARNTGIKAAKGEFITFLDDDDYYMPDRLAILKELLINNSEFDCAYSGVAISEKGGFLEVREGGRTGSFLTETLCHDTCWITGSNLFFTAKAINDVGEFDISFVRHQDTEFMCRFFLKGYKVISCSDYLVVKNQDDRKNDINVDKQIITKRHFLDKFRNFISPNEWNNINYRNYFIILWLCIKNKNLKQYKDIKKLVEQYHKIDKKTNIRLIIRWVYCCMPFSSLLFTIRRVKTIIKLGRKYNCINRFIVQMEKY